MTEPTMWPEKRTVVLLFGGRSSEHGVSCVTAAGVLREIDRTLFDVILVGITRTGANVLLQESDLTGFGLSGEVLPEVPENGTRVLWPASVKTRALTVVQPNGEISSLGRIDVVMPLLHGLYGEDGTVQGALELVDVPFVGSGVLSSSLCMDKHVAKTLFQSAGITVAPWRSVTRSQVARDEQFVETIASELSYPVFVKPNRAGSSVGVSKVAAPEQLPAALETAFAEDSVVLIEQAMVGREVEIAVLEGRDGAPPRTTPLVGEIAISGRDFYDFDAKYRGAEGISLILPAEVSEAELAAIRSAATTAFEVAQCAGLARVDFFLTEDGPVLNEVNTMPGFTPISMFPQLWAQAGLRYAELITELIELALHTHGETLTTK